MHLLALEKKSASLARFELTTRCLEGSDPGEVGVSFEPGVPRSCDRVGEFGKAVALLFSY